MPYAYATGENRVWTARDERELKADHKRATRATRKHLSDLQSQALAQAKIEKPLVPEEKSLMGKILRRRKTDIGQNREPTREVNLGDLSLERRSSPKAKQPGDSNPHWWSRGHRPTSSKSSQVTADSELKPYTPLGVANSTLPPPPRPPRYDLMSPSPGRGVVRELPPRACRTGESEAAARRRARDRALYHLEHDHDIRRYVVLDNPNDPPIQLKPGTWIPGQINAVDFSREVIAADKRADVDEFGGLTTPELIERFPMPPRSLPPRKNAPLAPLPSIPSPPTYMHLPPTRPLNIVRRNQYRDIRDIPIPPIPTEPPKSNRDSFIELRRKRSYRV
ncbi:hypothetical protein OPQ81_001248 [Rhizoctonia solani]|nr:hypothetical protein OPQ81_001248 [Rhizoctonia solani]